MSSADRQMRTHRPLGPKQPGLQLWLSDDFAFNSFFLSDLFLGNYLASLKPSSVALSRGGECVCVCAHACVHGLVCAHMHTYTPVIRRAVLRH